MSLPETNIDVSGGVEFISQPSLTWYINRETGRIQNTAEGLSAVRQAVEIILNVERFRWQVFSPYSGVQLADLPGLNFGYVALEVQRRIKEALAQDDRILDISDYQCSQNGDTLNISFTVNSVFGSFIAETEVLND